MRVDGSTKTVTAGVTTLDDKRHNGTYAKIVDNWRCDPMRGLLRRPAAQFIADILPNYQTNDALLPIVLDDTLYWLHIRPITNGQQLRLFDIEGSEIPILTESPTNYFETITGDESVSFVAIGNAVFLANKNRVVVKSDLRDIRNRSSMIVVKQAPAAFSKIEIQWTASDGIIYEVEYEVPEDPESGSGDPDRGTNTTAAAIAALMEAELPSEVLDNIYVQGSTILYQREDEDFAAITGTDGARDAVIATINSNTPDINNLGKYAGADCVVQIKPDPTSDRGSFYMRANPEIETETDLTYERRPTTFPLPAQAFIVTCGALDESFPPITGLPDLYNRGFYEGAFGSVSPTSWKGSTIAWFWQLSNSNQSQDNVSFNFVVYGDSPHVAEDLEFMWMIDQGTGQVHTSTPMEFIGSEQEEGIWVSGWTGNGGRLWEDGQILEVHDEYSDAIYGKLPEVRWEETADPDALNYLDITSMPHVLGVNSAGLWVFGPHGDNLNIPGVNALRARRAGDDDSNPFPTFIENNINDLGRFQDRLLVLSSDTVSMSVTDKPHGWFRETATQQLAIDPIGVKSSAQNALSLNYIVSHNNDALIFSRNAQYKLLGSVGMTSQNAALPQTTNYDSALSVKPISNASDVFFAIAYSATHAGISRFSVDKDTDSQDISLPVTNHVQNLIEGRIKILVASSTLNVLLVVTHETPNIIYVYEYVDSRREPQNAWARWLFPGDIDILGIAMLENFIQVAVRGTNNRVSLVFGQLNEVSTPGMTQTTFLDYRYVANNVGTTFSAPANYPHDDENLVLYQGEGCPNPEAEITNWSRSGNTITVPQMNGGSVAMGFPIKSVFMPSRRWIRDDSGTPQTASKLRITDYGFHAYGNDINVDILDGPETWPTQNFTNDDPDNDKYHRISFKQRHDEADLEIWTENPFPVEVLQLEWRGTYFKTGRRF